MNLTTRADNDHITDARAALLPTRDALSAVLRQLEAVLAITSPDLYTRTPVGPVHSSMGPHVRHALDHVQAWLDALPTGELDYDARQRGTAVEVDPAAALAQLRTQLARLAALPDDLPAAWRLRAQVAEQDPAQTYATSPARELAFVLSHTVHHYAILGVMCRVMGIATPERFGYAPATLAHLRATAQA